MTERLYAEVFENAKRALTEVNELCVKHGRKPASVAVMAVTKTQSPELVNAAIAAGIRLLGENRAQELLAKHQDYAVGSDSVHFIGHLQTNKVAKIIDKVSMIQSVDRMALAQEIDRQSQRVGRVMPVLVEVNIAAEPSKSGVHPEQLEALVASMEQLSHIKVCGLMAIPPADCGDLQKEKYFEKMHQHFVDIKAKKLDNINMQFLSMGMSEDYAAAIKHHSSIVRLGRAIFKDRG